ncbi:hypothetical protein AcV5_009816 [Taiwanofungus camphoratus]|nr:hypothetical protein AcV5_009816 [Antrodia cinnamomea]
MVAGRYIPLSTQVYVPPYSLHRDPRYFPLSPDDFIPNRWLRMTKEPAVFIPFSFGPANCAGRNLARTDMMMVVSLLLQRFELSLADGYNPAGWPDQLHDHFVLTRGSLWVKLRPRQQ